MSSIFKLFLSGPFSLLFLTWIFGLGAPIAIGDESFSPHMVDHENLGCPTNSSCDKETGRLFGRWIELLKQGKKAQPELNAFIAQHGYPFKVWSLLSAPSSSPKPGLISWDSQCEAHRPKADAVASQPVEPPVDQALVFVKSLQPEKYPDLLFDQAYLSDGLSDQSPVVAFTVPRATSPYSADADGLVFLEEEEGVYYYLKIDPKGKISVEMERPAKKASAQEVECPKFMLVHLAKNPPKKMIYQSYFCKKISSSKEARDSLVLLPFACD
jgi:hypothetical protein